MNRSPAPPSAPSAPSASSARPLRDALAADAGLASLLQRVEDSRRCLDAIAPLLPGPLLAQVRPGPLDATGWTLLAANAAAAAKLRQLAPRLDECLRDHRLPGVPVRIKVLPP